MSMLLAGAALGWLGCIGSFVAAAAGHLGLAYVCAAVALGYGAVAVLVARRSWIDARRRP